MSFVASIIYEFSRKMQIFLYFFYAYKTIVQNSSNSEMKKAKSKKVKNQNQKISKILTKLYKNQNQKTRQRLKTRETLNHKIRIKTS